MQLRPLLSSVAALVFVANACTLTANLDDLKSGKPDASAGTGGDAGQPDADADAPVVPTLPLRSVAAGGQHACVIDGANELYCWGANYAGQLGNGKTGGKQSFFVKAEIPETVVGAACGGQHSCAIGTSGKLYCWGSGTKGALGNGTSDQNVPTIVDGITSVAAVTAGANHTCAISAAGASCWGSNSDGQLGTGGGDTSTPTDVGIANVTSMAAGGQHTCVVAAGVVQCWGSNAFGQLGITGVASSPTPSLVTMPTGFVPKLVAAGGKHTCAGAEDGSVACWGNNLSGQLGLGTETTLEAPTALNGYTATALALGEEHSCGNSSGSVSCWGADDVGQIGNGPSASASSPAQLALTQVLSIATGTRFSCAVAANGAALWCWGDNTSSQLGNSTNTSETQPHQMPLTQ